MMEKLIHHIFSQNIDSECNFSRTVGRFEKKTNRKNKVQNSLSIYHCKQKLYEFVNWWNCKQENFVIYRIILQLAIKKTVKYCKGAFTNYADKFLSFFYHLPPTLTFSTFIMTKSQHFWATYPPLLVNVVCERHLILSTYYIKRLWKVVLIVN